ncbi:MAG: hypothetical protein QNJ70_20185 [Xenococcaceae cyanobacterium MO_207.B15]|nr:hypothetical protein [Xenococcaceae cyanobacterium MO_207.B15]MDJ0747452.1 hypothetical protein [Xenococcaceae cyanobacterium MO_167.B27]
MKKKPLKAVVATVRYAGFEFEGLRLPDSTYAIGIPQVVDLLARDINGFRPSKNTASRDFKRILGKRFRPSKIATELDNAKINVIGIETFGLLMIQLAIRGNEVAQAIAEASVTTTLEMAYDIAFNNKQKLEEYQARHEARVQGKLTRRSLTDAIQDYIKANADTLSDKYERFVYNNCSNAVNRIIFGRSAKKLKESWNCTELRDAMTSEELSHVDSVERLAVRLIDELGYEPFSAVKEAGNRLLIKQINR